MVEVWIIRLIENTIDVNLTGLLVDSDVSPAAGINMGKIDWTKLGKDLDYVGGEVVVANMRTQPQEIVNAMVNNDAGIDIF